MRRKKQKEIRILLKDLRSDDWSRVFEAGTGIYRFSNVLLKPLLSILEKFPKAHNREYAAYGLISVLLDLESKKINRTYLRANSIRNFDAAEGNRRKIKRIVRSLINTINHDESPKVKAQALETLGASSTGRNNNYKLRGVIEKSVMSALSDKSAEVRFWACYAAGQLKMKNALPKLSELAENDTEDWGQWWYISEEAEDAIDWIYGRETEARIPVAQRNKL